jgi:hypothetical protein
MGIAVFVLAGIAALTGHSTAAAALGGIGILTAMMAFRLGQLKVLKLEILKVFKLDARFGSPDDSLESDSGSDR